MPAEQTGIVKENYLWKVLLKKGESGEGLFFHCPVGWNDHDLFTIIWGSATAALSYVFDKSHDESILTVITIFLSSKLNLKFHLEVSHWLSKVCIDCCLLWNDQRI